MSVALRGVAELVERESGVRLGEHQHGALRAALRRAAPGTRPEDFLRLARDPLRRDAEIARLLDEVTVQESAFFRERAALEAVRWHELLAGAQASGGAVVRVWVAGCASGEEAYSLAILACEAFGPAEPPVSILASDLSRRALGRAQQATYRERALREVDPHRRARWLRRADGRYVVRDEVRRLVHFRRHNLVADPAPPPGEAPFHVVACRNVLIYFAPEVALAVSRRLEEALAPGGALLLGTADVLSAAAATYDAAPPERAAASARPAPPPRQRPPATLARSPLLARARLAAEAGQAGEALADLDTLIRREPLDAEAHALRGLVELAGGDADAAASSLRRALFAEPTFGAAAFMLGRAHDAAGRPSAARAAYARALRTLRPGDARDAAVLGESDPTEVLAACRARLEGASA